MLKIVDNGNGGEVLIENNEYSLEKGISTQVYLTLFGGNVEGNWVGNLYYADEKEKQFEHNIEKSLREFVYTKANIASLKSDIDLALKKLVTLGVVDEIESVITPVNRTYLMIDIRYTVNNIQSISRIDFRDSKVIFI